MKRNFRSTLYSIYATIKFNLTHISEGVSNRMKILKTKQLLVPLEAQLFSRRQGCEDSYIAKAAAATSCCSV
jgi:hypothetical protein